MKQEQKKHPKDYPEEYVTGTVIFFGREFHVSPDVLIPRLETEGLVRRARKIFGQGKFDRVVDIGSGSGIIGISLADLADEVIFLDISGDALRVAEKNFQRNYPNRRAKFIVSDLLDSEELSILASKNTLFLANLPYIKNGDWRNMSEDTKYEPELALFGGEKTGFELYEQLFEQLQMKNYQGRAIIEFGFDQREIAEESIKKHGWKYELFPDFSGIERFCEINLTNK